jgi:hypothetical protein
MLVALGRWLRSLPTRIALWFSAERRFRAIMRKVREEELRQKWIAQRRRKA